ncbi:MAG: hypothetical protein KME16_14520 [Scytolyngbya sp. HA4215-MV1]|nr:hypothetical protein [Scytolyngbya sp. HA4215-MV1]
MASDSIRTRANFTNYDRSTPPFPVDSFRFRRSGNYRISLSLSAIAK